MLKLEICRQSFKYKNKFIHFYHCKTSCHSQCKSIVSSPIVEFQAIKKENIIEIELIPDA